MTLEEVIDESITKILEINPEHEIFNVLQKITDQEQLSQYVDLLYDQAALIAGLQIEDPVKYSESIVKLMVDLNK